MSRGSQSSSLNSAPSWQRRSFLCLYPSTSFTLRSVRNPVGLFNHSVCSLGRTSRRLSLVSESGPFPQDASSYGGSQSNCAHQRGEPVTEVAKQEWSRTRCNGFGHCTATMNLVLEIRTRQVRVA